MRLIKKLIWPALLVILLLMACGGRQPAPELQGIDGWINSEPLTLAELRGKVVLIDFWTYTCVNCIRTFPYLKEWHEKYADSGLVIIGVHTPEFEFEKERHNVAEAARIHGLEYPSLRTTTTLPGTPTLTLPGRPSTSLTRTGTLDMSIWARAPMLRQRG
jgi:thiol-disulfide isomerase/thioredoxin